MGAGVAFGARVRACLLSWERFPFGFGGWAVAVDEGGLAALVQQGRGTHPSPWIRMGTAGFPHVAGTYVLA